MSFSVVHKIAGALLVVMFFVGIFNVLNDDGINKMKNRPMLEVIPAARNSFIHVWTSDDEDVKAWTQKIDESLERKNFLNFCKLFSKFLNISL